MFMQVNWMSLDVPVAEELPDMMALNRYTLYTVSALNRYMLDTVSTLGVQYFVATVIAY